MPKGHRKNKEFMLIFSKSQYSIWTLRIIENNGDIRQEILGSKSEIKCDLTQEHVLYTYFNDTLHKKFFKQPL